MTEQPEASSTRALFEELVNQGADLIAVEIDLLRAELSASSRQVSAGFRFLIAGVALSLAGAISLLAALCALLVRFGLPVDAACFLVAAAAILAGVILLRSGGRAFSSRNLLPRRSFGQIASLLKRR
jgi:hypothetical protein